LNKDFQPPIPGNNKELTVAKLAGKVALITGGNSGMGLESARLFAQEGAKVIITGRRQAELDAAVKYVGPNALGVQGDVSNLADLDRLFDTIRRKYDRLDIIFANAGFGVLTHVSKVTEAEFDAQFATNVKGLYFTVQKALPLLRDGSSIILNASIAASKGVENFSVYSATKAAVRSFARTLTTDLKSRKIRVNTLSPGPIDTPILTKAGLTSEQVAGWLESLKAGIPLGRIGRSDEIAKVALFLASDDSSYVTGIELTVDGGMAQI
jgi:NAD(P)-dependent dehydrogenase (short-subunit alcohol dehydrogenase family)